MKLFFVMGVIYDRIQAANRMKCQMCINMIRAERWAGRQESNIAAEKDHRNIELFMNGLTQTSI